MQHTLGSLNTLGVLKLAKVVNRVLVVLNGLKLVNCDGIHLAYPLEATCKPDRQAMARPPQLFREAAMVNCDPRSLT